MRRTTAECCRVPSTLTSRLQSSPMLMDLRLLSMRYPLLSQHSTGGRKVGWGVAARSSILCRPALRVSGQNSMNPPPSLTALRLLLLLAIVLGFFVNLHSVPLFDLDEGACSEATREMLLRADFISPYLIGVPRFDKPAFIHWLQAASVTLLGWNEFALRLPSALAATAWVLVVYAFARTVRDERTGLIAAIAMATSLEIPLIAKAATADAVLNLFITAALLTAFLYYQRGQRRYLYLCFVLMGHGFLTKGPVAVAIPGAVTLLFYASKGEWRAWLRAVTNPAGDLDRRAAVYRRTAQDARAGQGAVARRAPALSAHLVFAGAGVVLAVQYQTAALRGVRVRGPLPAHGAQFRHTARAHLAVPAAAVAVRGRAAAARDHRLRSAAHQGWICGGHAARSRRLLRRRLSTVFRRRHCTLAVFPRGGAAQCRDPAAGQRARHGVCCVGDDHPGGGCAPTSAYQRGGGHRQGP